MKRVGLIRKTPLRPFSKKRRGYLVARRRVREQVLERDGGRCQWSKWAALPGMAGCFGPLHVHEPLTRARGGDPLDPDQCVTLCSFHHLWCHRNPEQAASLGLLKHSWDR